MSKSSLPSNFCGLACILGLISSNKQISFIEAFSLSLFFAEWRQPNLLSFLYYISFFVFFGVVKPQMNNLITILRGWESPNKSFKPKEMDCCCGPTYLWWWPRKLKWRFSQDFARGKLILEIIASRCASTGKIESYEHGEPGRSDFWKHLFLLSDWLDQKRMRKLF